MLLDDIKSLDKLEEIQSNIQVNDVILNGIYMCDCTGCESGCFEFCSDGQGPTN